MYDIKYAPFADSYIGMAHGDTYEHVKRWLKQRFTFVDTLFDYAPSYNNDVLTIRANTTELMTLEIETYTPVYQHLSWYNGQMDKKKIDGKVSVEFSGTAQAATDQEVLIYGGSNVKSIKGITSMNPNRMLIGSATKLVEIDAHDCPLLADINANKANLSPHEYLNKVNLSNCPLLEGNLRLNNSPLVQEINIKGTNITGMNLPSSIRNLQTLRLPNTMTDLTLNDASMLHTLEFDGGVALQSVSMTNCNALTNVVNFDLLQTPSITLNNSYNTAAELYFRDTTNLSLSNMPNLERVIFTPNNEYETFELINVANAPNYKVTTFNCPKLSTFMTTAPYRESYNNGDYGDIQPNTTFTANSIDISNTQFTDVKLLCTTDVNTLKLPTTVKNFYCDSSFDLDTDYLEDGEYDVVHGELVEPYTTDYEGEVLFDDVIEKRYSRGEITYPNVSGYDYTTDKIPIENAYKLDIFLETGVQWQGVDFFDKDENLLSQYGASIAARTIEVPSDAKWMTIWCNNGINMKQGYRLYYKRIPNLIPSSADGSLIFSMYAPNNTVAPASGTWDLHGLEFDNFHTFGMNNDVKLSEDSYVKVVNPSDIIAYTGKATNNGFPLGQIYWDVGQSKNIAFTCIRLSAGSHTITTSTGGNVLIYVYSNIGDTTKLSQAFGANGFTLDSPKYIAFQLPNTTEYVEIDGCRIYFDEITIIDGQLYKDSSGWYNYLECGGYEIIFDDVRVDKILDAPTSISMPARYDDYNITIKNANISPKTYNTMLYPLLVNEDNPITGTLDYTNYAGKHLSWSFAYTDEEYVSITQPKDELINSYEYKYNAFYDTEYEFDNPYEIARYTSSASGVLPTFNSEFTYTYDEIDNGDGTYTTKVYAEDLDNLPTRISFSGKTTLLSVDKLNTSRVTDMTQMFRDCTGLTSLDLSKLDTSNVTVMNNVFFYCKNLTSLNISNWDTSNVLYMTNMFQYCERLVTLDMSNWDTSNVTDMNNMFNGCKALTTLNVSEFDTSKVTNMNSMFNGCSNLTSLDLSGFDTNNVTDMKSMFNVCSNLTSLDLSGFNTTNVSNMSSMFQSCSKLTSLDVSGFDTGDVTDMSYMFYNCNNLTSLDLSGFDTSKVTTMEYMFADCKNLTTLDVSRFDTSNVTNMRNMFSGCNKLTSLDLSGFDTSNVTDMSAMFYACWSLKEVKGIENWNCSKVDKFGSMFQGATAFGGDLDLRNWKVGQNATVTAIFGFMNGCTNLKSVDMSGWVLPDNINLANFMANQGSLHTVRVIGWSAVNIQNLCVVIGLYVGGTIYGSVIIDESYLRNNWIYNNVLEVAVYTCNTSGVLPNFNTEFTYTHAEVDNEDGTYTTKISADSIENLPTSISFYTKSALLSVERMNVSKVTSAQGMFYQCSNVTYINSSNWNTSSMTTMNNMFNGCSKLTSLDVSGFDTVNVTNMFGMFSGCSGLTSLDVSGFDTSKVTTMGGMFDNCPNLTSLDVSNFDTSNVINMSMMFRNCNKLIALNVSNFDTSKVTTMNEMFNGCNVLSIEGLGNWDVKSVTDMGGMFLHCRGITSLLEISDWNTSSLKNLYRTFMGCTELIELDVSNWNTSKLETLLEAFYSCVKIISFNLGNWDCRRVISISGAFQGCSSLSSIVLPKEVGKGCNAVSALKNCTNLKEVALPKGIGNISHMLNNCYNLEKTVIPLDDITDVQDTTFNNCRALVNIDWVGDLSNNFNIIWNTGEHITTESDVHELMTNLGDLKKDKIKISLSKGTIKVNDTEKTIE